MIDSAIPVAQGVQLYDAAEVVTSRGRVHQQRVQVLGGFMIPEYDYIEFGYTGSNITTITYKSGGSTGSTLATLTLGYSGSNVTSITKS